jgi:hypothetical protein
LAQRGHRPHAGATELSSYSSTERWCATA